MNECGCRAARIFTRLSARAFARLGVMRGCALHYSCGAARRVRSHIPGALSILKGAVPDRARGLGHMAPTYLGREPGIERSDGRRGSALSMRASPVSSWLDLFRPSTSLPLRALKTWMPGKASESTPFFERLWAGRDGAEPEFAVGKGRRFESAIAPRSAYAPRCSACGDA